MPSNSAIKELQALLEQGQQEFLPQVKTQLNRVEQATYRHEKLSGTEGDLSQKKQAMAKQELHILNKNLNMIKSRARTKGVKAMSQCLTQMRKTDDIDPVNFEQIYQGFSLLYVDQFMPAADEQVLDALLSLIWSHLKALKSDTTFLVDVNAESEQVKNFKQASFHPLEKMALTQLHGLLVQIHVYVHKHQKNKDLQEISVQETLVPNMTPPEQSLEDLKKNLHRLQRTLFQIKAQLRRQSMPQKLREKTLLQMQNQLDEQAETYSQLRQWLIWECLNQLTEHLQRFDALENQLKNSIDIESGQGISDKSAFYKRLLSQDFYKLYLECQQLHFGPDELLSLPYIQVQQDKVSQLGMDDYKSYFEAMKLKDQTLLDRLHASSQILENELEYLSEVRPPLHRIISKLEILEL